MYELQKQVMKNATVVKYSALVRFVKNAMKVTIVLNITQLNVNHVKLVTIQSIEI